MQEISSLPVYTGVIPNKATQNDYDFANNIFGFINYSGNTLIPFFNDTITDLNILSGQINIKADEVLANSIIATGFTNYQGGWNSSTTYTKGQSVSFNGLYYVSKVDNNLNHLVTDTNYWLYNPINGTVLAGEIKAIYSRLAGTYPIPASGVVDQNGYMYCNGSTIPNGYTMTGTVPNLTDGRFLRGSTESGSSGQDAFTITASNLPAHTHTFSATTSSVGNHTHSAWTDTQGEHQHTTFIGRYFGATKASNTGFGIGGYGVTSSNGYEDGLVTTSAGSHGHGVGIGGAGEHSHTVSGITSSIGGGTSITHIPKYVDVKFIIKVK